MSLNNIYAQLFAEYAKVSGIANNFARFYDGQMQVALQQMKAYVADAVALIPHMTHTSSKRMARALEQNVQIITEDLRQTKKVTDSIAGGLRSIFNTHLYNVFRNVQQASVFIEDALYDEVYNLALTVDNELLLIEQALLDEMETVRDQIDLLSVDVTGWIDAAVADLNTTLTARIDDVDTTLSQRIDDLDAWVANAVNSLYNYIDGQIAQLLVYTDDAINTLYVYINNRIKEVNNKIVGVENRLTSRLNSEIDAMEQKLRATEITLTSRIEEAMALADYNFTFFDLFTFRPELSLLRVLLRSEGEFNRFKPYWQALFAKVFAEE